MEGNRLDPNRLDPYQAEALEMWRRAKFIECCTDLCELVEQDLDDWECYNTICVECEEHDKCFAHSDWFLFLID